MKYGYFGGTFDPIHFAHLLIAETIKDLLLLEKVCFIPAGNPPHKGNQQITSTNHRLEMLSLAIQDNPKFELSEIEIKQKEKSYSVNTLRFLNQNMKTKNIFWIIGSDNLHMMHTWREPEEIFKLSQVVVYERTNYPLADARSEYRDRSIILNTPIIDISASEIRKKVNRNQSIRYLVPKDVEVYIEKNGLYKSQ